MPSSFNYSPTPTAGSVTATASGKLSDGSKVILNSDGTVSVIAATGSSTAQSISGGAITSNNVSGVRGIAAVYGSVDNTIVLWFKDQSTGYLFAVTAIITGSVITFGTPVAIVSSTIYIGNTGLSAAFDPINNRYYCLYVETAANTYGGTAICTTQGLKVVSQGYNSYAWAGTYQYPRGFSLIISPTLNGANQQALITYTSSVYGDYRQQAIACKMTSTNITYGTEYLLYADYQEQPFTPCFISESIAAIPGKNTSGYPSLSIVTLSNTTLTINNQTVLNADNNVYAKAVAYNATTGNLFCAFQADTSNTTKGVLITLSGTTPTLGTVTTIRSGASTSVNSVVANPVTGDFWYQAGNEALRIIPSGTTFTVGTQITIAFPLASNTDQGNMIYNPANYSFVVPAGQNVQIATFKGFTSTLNSNNFLGISSASYATGSAATIQTIGSVDDAQSGLTAGTDYFVSPSGTLDSIATGQPYAGLALSPTRLLIKG
jgi:hypothetical protein